MKVSGQLLFLGSLGNTEISSHCGKESDTILLQKRAELLERLGWGGKKVMAVMPHEGNSLGSYERDLKRICSGAIGEPLFLWFFDTTDNMAIDTIWQKYIFRQKSGVSKIVCKICNFFCPSN